MSGNRPRIGMVGAGWFGTAANLPSLRDYEHAELVALCDLNPERLHRVADEFDIRNRFTSLGELLAADAIDGLVVSVPGAFHAETSQAALASGVHVLVEKPMALRATEAWRMVELAETAGLHLMVGQTYHFTPAAIAAKRTLPELGELELIEGTFASPMMHLFNGAAAGDDGYGAGYGDPSQAGGGQGQTQLSHLAGCITWATGARAETVFAMFDERGTAVDVVNAITARLSNGALLTIAATGDLSPEQTPRQRITYYGSKGVLVHDLWAGSAEVQWRDGTRDVLASVETSNGYPVGAPARAFADLISGRSAVSLAPPVPAARSVELIEAAYRSAEHGRALRTDELRAGNEAVAR